MPQILRRSALLLLFWIFLLDWALVALVWGILAENPDRLFVAPYVQGTAIAIICFVFPSFFILFVFLIFIGPALLVRSEARGPIPDRPAARGIAILFVLVCVMAQFAISLVLGIAAGFLASLTPPVFSAGLSPRLIAYLAEAGLVTTLNSAATITAIAAALAQNRAGAADPGDVASAFD